MSAFMIEDEIFAQLARFLDETRPDILEVMFPETPAVLIETMRDVFGHDVPATLTGRSLVEAMRRLNRESIASRYPQERERMVALAASDPPIDPLSIHVCTAKQAAKHTACIDYQACETELWETSGMMDLCKRIGDAIAASAEETHLELRWGYVGPEPCPPPPAAPPAAPEKWLSAAERAKVIRDRLKAMGIKTRDVSVRARTYSMGSSIDVRIKNADVSYKAVCEVAHEHEKIDRDHVSVDLDDAAFRAVVATVEAMPEGERAYLGRRIVPLYDGGDTQVGWHVPGLSYYGRLDTVREAVWRIYKEGPPSLADRILEMSESA